jgi:hypothetical protein
MDVAAAMASAPPQRLDLQLRRASSMGSNGSGIDTF